MKVIFNTKGTEYKPRVGDIFLAKQKIHIGVGYPDKTEEVIYRLSVSPTEPRHYSWTIINSARPNDAYMGAWDSVGDAVNALVGNYDTVQPIDAHLVVTKVGKPVRDNYDERLGEFKDEG